MEKEPFLPEGTSIIEVEDLADILLAAQSSSWGSSYVVRDPYPTNLKIIDCSGTRGARENYKQERIPGAKFLDINEKFIDPQGKYPSTYPTESVIRKRLGELGIHLNDEIVFYVQDGTIRFAARAWFIFKSVGFEKAAVLNGGLIQWKANGYPVENCDPPEELDEEFYSSLDDYSDHLVTYADIKVIENHTDENLIIDVRSKKQYEGEEVPSLEGCKPGHIPNAINLYSAHIFKDNGAFKSVEDMKEVFEKAGVDKGKQIISYWNNATSATAVALALKECGYHNVKLYDGSWSEYGSNL